MTSCGDTATATGAAAAGAGEGACRRASASVAAVLRPAITGTLVKLLVDVDAAPLTVLTAGLVAGGTCPGLMGPVVLVLVVNAVTEGKSCNLGMLLR